MEKDFKYDFKTLKRHVGVDDVAFTLGYKIDRSAGIGKYIELVKGSMANPDDRIIVTNTPQKEAQRFFRRNGQKGDVISFVRENLNSFNVPGTNEWERIGAAMAKIGNLPVIDRPEIERARRQSSDGYDAARYKIASLDTTKVGQLLKVRGFDEKTIRAFTPYLNVIRDLQNGKYSGYNLGFPYTDAKGDVVGFEIRGNKGFKSKAAGTSSSGCWVADMSLQSQYPNVKKLYFFESSFDAMAYYQANRLRIDPFSSAFVSLGGSFSDNQIINLRKRFPQSTFVECFDNDIAGRIYALRLLGLENRKPMKIDHIDNAIAVSSEAVSIAFPESMIKQMAEMFAVAANFEKNIEHHTAPDGFKDWNDFILDKPIERKETVSAYQRDQNLSEKRTNSLHL